MKTRTQQEIMNNWRASKTPMVSICCIAYNHAGYIRQCIDGFLMQVTNFPIEILIHDDASTDNTAEIIKEYESLYPDIIKPIYQTENQFSNGVKINSTYNFPRAEGDYIALCEGDDYWIDPLKLQKQIGFLESNPDCCLCFHPVRVIFENHEKADYIHPETNDPSQFTVEYLLKKNFIQTNSVMYRKQQYADMPPNILPGDWYWHLYHAQFGKIGFINEVMSVYRRHPGGLWWDGYNNRDRLYIKHGLSHFRFYCEVMKLFGYSKSYKEIVLNQMLNFLSRFISIDNMNNEEIFNAVLDNTNELLVRELLYQMIVTGKNMEASLYIDTGNGFLEGQKILKHVYYGDKQFTIKFDQFVNKPVKSLRFDPIEGQLIRIKLNRIVIKTPQKEQEMDLSLAKCNGIKKDDSYYEFDTLDPWIFLPVQGVIMSLEISGELEKFPLMKLIEEKESQLKEKESQLKEKESQLKEKESQLKEKESQLKEKERLIMSMYNSFTWKIGRMIVWIPEKIMSTNLFGLRKIINLLEEYKHKKTVYLNYRKLNTPSVKTVKKKLLIVTHNLNHEGAPNSALQIAIGLKDKYYIEVISLADGPLKKEYKKKGIDVNIIKRDFDILQYLNWFDVIYMNTIVTSPLMFDNRRILQKTYWCIRESEIKFYLQEYKDYDLSNLFNEVCKVIFVSDATLNLYNYFNKKNNFIKIYNGINIKKIDHYVNIKNKNKLRQKYKYSNNKIIVLNVGSVTHRKGQDVFVDAANQLLKNKYTNILFIAIGGRETDFCNDLIKRIEDYGIQDNVLVLPENRRVYDYYLMADIFACPSRSESLPRVVMEAMAFKLPVIATNVFGIPEQVVNGQTGFLIEPDRPDQLAEKIEKYVNDKNLVKDHGLQGYRRCKEVFSYEEMLSRYIEIFN